MGSQNLIGPRFPWTCGAIAIVARLLARRSDRSLATGAKITASSHQSEEPASSLSIAQSVPRSGHESWAKFDGPAFKTNPIESAGNLTTLAPSNGKMGGSETAATGITNRPSEVLAPPPQASSGQLANARSEGQCLRSNVPTGVQASSRVDAANREVKVPVTAADRIARPVPPSQTRWGSLA